MDRFFHWGNERYSSQKLYKLAFAGIEAPSTFSGFRKVSEFHKLNSLVG